MKSIKYANFKSKTSKCLNLILILFNKKSKNVLKRSCWLLSQLEKLQFKIMCHAAEVFHQSYCSVRECLMITCSLLVYCTYLFLDDSG